MFFIRGQIIIKQLNVHKVRENCIFSTSSLSVYVSTIENTINIILDKNILYTMQYSRSTLDKNKLYTIQCNITDMMINKCQYNAIVLLRFSIIASCEELEINFKL